MPRFRFTVRRMMVAVAIAAIELGGFMLTLRHIDFRRRSDYYWGWADPLITSTTRFEAGEEPIKRRSCAEYYTDQRLGRYYERLARKYDRAARYPWLPVAPDPPEPE